MNYTETVAYLYAYLPMYQRVGSSAFKKDLKNTLLLLETLGNPQHKFKTIHIAGTNGKGSTAHSLAAILQSAGYKTGLYTSPHLKNFTERIRINGEEIAESSVVSFVKRMQTAMETIKPSFFEVTVAMAFDAFAREAVDIAVIETGLGGRLDSTNVIRPELSIITNIGFDHQAILGDTLEAIASEKAGIIKPETPVVVGEFQEEIASVFKNKAFLSRAPLFFASQQYQVNLQEAGAGHFVVDVYDRDRLCLKALKLSLSGNYQLKNLPGILKAIDILTQKGYHISEEAIRAGLSQVQSLTGLKGRWQVLQQSPLVICDTGHNEAGLHYITKQLATLNYQRLYMVIGVVNDKKLEGMFAALPKDAFYYFCQANVPRALPADLLSEQAAHFSLYGKVVLDVNTALEEAKAQADKSDVIFVGGSSFVVAEIEGL